MMLMTTHISHGNIQASVMLMTTHISYGNIQALMMLMTTKYCSVEFARNAFTSSSKTSGGALPTY